MLNKNHNFETFSLLCVCGFRTEHLRLSLNRFGSSLGYITTENDSEYVTSFPESIWLFGIQAAFIDHADPS